MFSEIEIRKICESRPDMIALSSAVELRCPPRIYAHILENRARKLGIVHTLDPVEMTDADRRAASARTAALVAADAEAEELKQEILRGYRF